VPEEPSDLEALSAFFEELVLPLLRADGADAELLEIADSVLTVRVFGSAAFGIGSHYVRTSIIERAVREVRPGLTVRYEMIAQRPVKGS
jgi:Fe-S cluster biogenesis protein NfuA